MGQALADTYLDSYGRLRNVAARFVRRQDADDLVQDTVTNALAAQYLKKAQEKAAGQ